MHILYVHQNFPAQFGHIGTRLVERQGWKITFVTNAAGTDAGSIERVVYKVAGGATKRNHFCSCTFENTIWHCDGVYQALKPRTDLKPDLIVAHSGFGSSLFLRELYPQVPVINLFEFYYHTGGPDCDMGFRHDLGWSLPDAYLHRARARNAMILLDLQNCDAGYTPTRFQFSRFPAEYQPKLRVIFDGIDRSTYHGHGEELRPCPNQRRVRQILGVSVPPSTRVITYVARGFESMRGFDIFMKTAQRIYQQYPDALFFVVGSDRICYGDDQNHLDGAVSFREWVLSKDQYDLTKFRFVGMLPAGTLAQLLAAADLHIYLTAPFVLSWSLMNALSCGAVVLGSRTAPVLEMIHDGTNGLLEDFFDIEGLARTALRVLKDPAAFRPLGRSAETLITDQYSLDAVMPRFVDFYNEARRVQVETRMTKPEVRIKSE